MAAKVFISYRREDSAASAGRIRDRLEREFGGDILFIDVDGVPLGINFVKVLREEVAKCGVLLAVIGPDWLDVRDDDGNRRLENPTDFVRIEIAAALQRDIPVVPILLDGTRVPKADQLPKDLKELAQRNGLNVRYDSFHTDMDRLIRGLAGQVGAPRQTIPDPPPVSASRPRREPNRPKRAPSRLSVAQALLDKGVGLGALGRSEEEIAVYDDVLARFGTATEPPLRELVARALVNKALRLGVLGRGEEEIAVYDDVLARFGSAAELPLRERVANALLNKALRLGVLGRAEKAIAVYDDVLARFGSATELPLRELAANALLNKGLKLGMLGRAEEEIAVCDDLLARFGTATELPLRELVVRAKSARDRLRNSQALDRPGILPVEIERRPTVVADTASSRNATPGEIIAAPDRSYIIARPPENWSIREATVESDLKAKLGVEDISSLPELPTSSILMLQFGDGFTYTPRPDRTRLNGRRIPLLLSEPVQRALRITTVPRRQPPFFVERSLYDNSLMQVTLMVQLQIASLVSLTPGTLPKTNRDMLVAELVQEFEDLVVGDREVAKLRIDIRVTAIRGDLFDYVFATTNFRVGEGRDTMAERMDEDVLALFDSFSIASVVDPKAAERAELLRADQGFETFLSTHGAKMFGGQLGIAAGRLRETEYDTPEGIARAMSTLRPFRIFAGMLLHDPDIDMPDLWAAMAAAEQGDSAPLRNFLDENLKTSTASAQAAAPAPQTHPALMPPTDLVQDGAAAEP